MVLALFLRWCRLRRTHIFLVRLRLFASKRRKDGSCGSVISFNPSSSFPSFPFAWKGTIEKRERLPGVSDFLLKGAALYAERFVHHYKNTVQFYRECKRVVLSVWDREQFYFFFSSLFPFCIIISQQIAILWPKYKKNMFKVNFYVWFTLKVVASCRFPNYFQ